jgi:hypothetical protein
MLLLHGLCLSSALDKCSRGKLLLWEDQLPGPGSTPGARHRGCHRGQSVAPATARCVTLAVRDSDLAMRRLRGEAGAWSARS